MNLLRNKSINIVKAIFLQPSRMFVGLKPDVIKSLNALDTPRKYYDQLLEEAPFNDKGFIKVEPSHLNSIIERCKTAEDIPVAVEAYINLLGHRTFFANKTIDSLLLKSVECQNPKAVFEILKNHNYLMYYPHYDVLTRISEYYRETKNFDEAKEFLNIVVNAQLIKFSHALFRSVVELSKEAGDVSFAVKAYTICQKQQIKLDQGEYSYVLETAKQVAADTKKAVGVEKDLISKIDTSKLQVSDYLQMSLSLIYSLPAAVGVIQSMAENHKPTIKDGSFYFDNTEPTKEYFTLMYEALSKNSYYHHQFTSAIKEIKRKYLKNAAAPEILKIMYENNLKMADYIKSRGENKGKAAEGEKAQAAPAQ